MAKTYSAEYVTKLKLDYKEATKNLDEFQKEYAKLEKQVQDQNNATSKSIKNIEKSSGSAAKGIKGIGNAIKAAGIGLAIAAFAKLTEVFNQNQKVADFFNTTFEVLSLTFNDFFSFLQRNIGAVSGYFKAIFDDPIQSIKDFSSAIYDGIVARLKQGLEALGMFGSAAIKFFAGDFTGAFQTAKDASKELFDVVTGEDGGYEKIKESVKGAVQGIKEYAKSTIDTATSMVELNKQARLNEVINQGLIEKYDRQAEQLRQVRDDEANTIQERIAANEELGRVLDEQEKKMLENAQARILAADLELSKNRDNIEAQIEYQEALNERAAIEAQIEGFRSEQLMNRMSLQRELDELKNESTEVDNKSTEQELANIKDVLDATINSAGEETKIGKALFIAKQGIRLKEQIEEARATLSRITLRASEAGVDIAKGAASTAKIGFPQNIPMLIAFAGQAAGIISSVRAAVSATKSSASSFGGGFSSTTPSLQAPDIGTSQAPDFNVVGVGGTNQLADAIAGAQARPQRAYVVSNDVTTAQGLERNIVEGASI